MSALTDEVDLVCSLDLIDCVDVRPREVLVSIAGERAAIQDVGGGEAFDPEPLGLRQGNDRDGIH